MAAVILSSWAKTVEFGRALAWQDRLVAARQADLTPDVILGLQHPPVYTAGRYADIASNFTGACPEVPVVRIDRGGQLTYHGPGQVVAYPIIRLGAGLGVREYVHRLEQALIDTVRPLGVRAHRREGHPGVWVGEDKLAAIGIRVTGRVTKHGVALNVDPDLRHYEGIIPCGITDGGVTSLALLGVQADPAEVAQELFRALAERLDRSLRQVEPDQLRPPLDSAV